MHVSVFQCFLFLCFINKKKKAMSKKQKNVDNSSGSAKKELLEVWFHGRTGQQPSKMFFFCGEKLPNDSIKLTKLKHQETKDLELVKVESLF